MKKAKSIRWIFSGGLIALVLGCAQNNVRTNENSAGYFVDQASARARGGVSNYVDRYSNSTTTVAENTSVQIEEKVATKQTTRFSPRTEISRLVSLSQPGLYFAPASASIQAKDEARLAEIAAALRENPEARVELSGYTDQLGSKKANLRLSERRAQAVRASLIRNGASADQVRIHAQGENSPAASNRSAQGRALNRRVELALVSNS